MPQPRTAGKSSKLWIYLLIAAVALVALIPIGVVVAGLWFSHQEKDAASEAAVVSDAKNLATSIEVYIVDAGAAPSAIEALGSSMTLRPGDEVRDYESEQTDYRFCVVNTSNGAWALYDSTQGGLAGRGESGADCTPN